jgi:anti-anti-sigma regulatory factor
MESAEIQDAPQPQSVFIIRLEGEFDIADRERLTDAFATANSAPLVVVDLNC